MTPEKIRLSFGPKAAGASYLHENSPTDNIKHFITFSSVSALFGNPGQTNYAASNSYLDALCRLRRNKGLPAVSIQWPAIADVGMAAANGKNLSKSLKSQLSLSNVKKVLKQLLLTSNLSDDEAVRSPIPFAMLGLDRIPKSLSTFMSDVAIKSNKNTRQRSPKKARKVSSKVWSIDEIQSSIETVVKKVITAGDSESVDRQVSLMDLGLDSLGTTELSELLQSTFDIELSSTFVFNNPTIMAMSNYISGLLAKETQPADETDSASSMVNFITSSTNTELSIVGMSCRFPGNASNIHEYWDLISEGKNTSSHIPFDRWDVSSLTARSNLTAKVKNQVSHGSFVDDIESFDASFFNISKSEAEFMSPLQRALLECSYMALLDAGYTAGEMKGLNCGVYVGILNTSTSLDRPSNNDRENTKKSVFSATGATSSIASGRISYLFNFKGPNAAYDTACSSSLVALDAAMSALKEGKCEMALVAGANELFDSKVFESCARAGMLSPTGRCHSWDESADGYLRGEGCGVILLKRADSVSPGSTYANVLGTSIMSDGTSASITAPSE